MTTAFDWIWALLPLIAGTVFLFWVYSLQQRVDALERRLEDLEEEGI